jgi:hypothetical protein
MHDPQVGGCPESCPQILPAVKRPTSEFAWWRYAPTPGCPRSTASSGWSPVQRCDSGTGPGPRFVSGVVVPAGEQWTMAADQTWPLLHHPGCTVLGWAGLGWHPARRTARPVGAGGVGPLVRSGSQTASAHRRAGSRGIASANPRAMALHQRAGRRATAPLARITAAVDTGVHGSRPCGPTTSRRCGGAIDQRRTEGPDQPRANAQGPPDATPTAT